MMPTATMPRELNDAPPPRSFANDPDIIALRCLLEHHLDTAAAEKIVGALTRKKSAVGVWSIRRVHEMLTLWFDGKTSGAIAAELDLSRNAIIGQLHRLELRDTDRAQQNRRNVARPKADSGAAQPKAAEPRLAVAKSMATPQREPAESEPPPYEAPRAADPSAPSEGIALFDLRDHHCRFPVFGTGETILFCGATKASRVIGALPCPYCARHAAIAYAPSQRSERQREADESRRRLARQRTAKREAVAV